MLTEFVPSSETYTFNLNVSGVCTLIKHIIWLEENCNVLKYNEGTHIFESFGHEDINEGFP